MHYGWIYGGYLPVQKIVLKNLSRLGLLLLVLWVSRRAETLGAHGPRLLLMLDSTTSIWSSVGEFQSAN